MRSKLPVVAAGLCVAVLAARGMNPPRDDSHATTSVTVRQMDVPHRFKQLLPPDRGWSDFGWLIAATSLATLAAGSAVFEWVRPRSDSPIQEPSQ